MEAYRILPAVKVDELNSLNEQTWPHRVTPRMGLDGVLYVPEGVVNAAPFSTHSSFLKTLSAASEQPTWPPDPEI